MPKILEDYRALAQEETQSFRSLLWAVSIALSWTWGLGLFFSVQMALHFGLGGLLAFLIPNSLGLVLFGWLTQRIANRHPEPREFERHFFRTGNALKLIFILYQIIAVTLTFFAVFRYLLEPIGINMGLGVLLFVGAAMILGETFDIRRIKWSHLAAFIAILLCMVLLVAGVTSIVGASGSSPSLYPGASPLASWNFVGFLIPIMAGLLVGPWLDLQQWQRALQIHREAASVRRAYLYGSIIFFLILLFHGILALVIASHVAPTPMLTADATGTHFKHSVTAFLFNPENGAGWWLKSAYVIFITLCIITTLDSGYIAFRWYLKELVRKSEHIVLTIIPDWAVSHPSVPMVASVGIAAVSVLLNFELEYFMAFYGSFLVGYAIVFLFRTTYRPEFTNFTQTTLFSVACFAVGLFGVGYFDRMWYFMVVGSLLPLIHGFAVISGRVVVDDLQKALPKPDSTDEVPVASVSGKAAEMAVTALENAITRLDPKVGDKVRTIIHKIEPQAAHALAHLLSSIHPQGGGELVMARPVDEDADIEHARGRFEGKWYCHTFMTTYDDTNSVGNVYYANYVKYVGKVREMFFRACMPDFDLKNTGFFILTRAFEHKFNLEAREFDVLTVRIRVESFNRKFVTLEHQITNQTRDILGKGKQVLMFVNSADYRLVDLPNEVRTAFLPYIPGGS